MARPAVDSLAFALATAARAVAAVIGGRNLEVALAALAVPAAARPAVMDLAYSTLRCHGRGDFFLARLMARPLADPAVRGLLLAALWRLETRPEDAHTTVDQAVTAAAGLARGRHQALVNGVLRNFLRRRDELLAAAGRDETARWQHPRWWLAELRSAFPERWREVAEAGNGRAPMTLRVNRRRVAAADFQRLLADAGIAADPLGGAGMRVLDACAAPGGKTAHLLELADVELTALELDATRACRIGDNLRRLGLAAEVKIADCRDVDAWWDGRPFDRILADVPCAASGVARRHPDIKWLRRPGDVARFAATQREILDALWRLLAPGGKMLYATCSLFAEENGRQVAAFVARHGDAQRLPMPDHDKECEWQLLPDADHDGFYYALLAKAR